MGKKPKAKLDSRGRPLATRVQEPDEEEKKRTDHKLVRTAVRLGVFTFFLSTQTGCEPEAKELPAAIDPRVELAVAAAQTAAADAVTSSLLAGEAAKSALASAVRCEAAKAP